MSIRLARIVPWPRLLLAGLVGATLGSAFLLLTWDPTTRLAELEVTPVQVDRYDHRCSRSTVGPAGGPTICKNVVFFRSAEGREFFFAYADELRPFRPDAPLELGHSKGGQIWFVRQGATEVASYDEVKELHNQHTRLGRFFGLLGCLAMVVIGGRAGLLRLRAGPACPTLLCRILDFVTLAFLALAAVTIAFGDLSIALWATGGAFVSFMGGIGWAKGRRHIDADAFKTKLLQGSLVDRWQEASERFNRWGEEFSPPKGSLTLPWRVIASVRAGCSIVGSFTILGFTLSSLMFIVVPGVDEPGAWREMTGFVVFGAVLVVLAGLLGHPVRKAAASSDGRTWLGWIILLSPPLLLFLSATVRH